MSSNIHLQGMSFSVRATPSNLVSYPVSYAASILRPLHSPTQANQFERNYDARRLCNWEVRRHMHAGGLNKRHQATTGPYIDVQSPRGIEARAHGGPIT